MARAQALPLPLSGSGVAAMESDVLGHVRLITKSGLDRSLWELMSLGNEIWIAGSRCDARLWMDTRYTIRDRVGWIGKIWMRGLLHCSTVLGKGHDRMRRKVRERWSRGWCGKGVCSGSTVYLSVCRQHGVNRMRCYMTSADTLIAPAESRSLCTFCSPAGFVAELLYLVES